MSGETILSTQAPMSAASFTASSAEPATPSFGTEIPYASHTSLPSGAVRLSRPSDFTWSRILRTESLAVWVVSSIRVLRDISGIHLKRGGGAVPHPGRSLGSHPRLHAAKRARLLDRIDPLRIE